jgi:hypothetical protein
VIWDGSPIHRGHEIKEFRQQRSRQTFAPGTTAGVCTRSQPRRGYLELSQTRRVGQCLLCQPSITSLLRSYEPESACGISVRSFAVVHDNVAIRFSFLARDQ